MELGERDCLVVVLAATAGATDAWSYFGLGHVFIANMTGNTVLLGAAFSHGKWTEVARPLGAVGAYVCGVFMGTVLLDRVLGVADESVSVDEERGAQVWPGKISWILGLESMLLIAVALVWARHGGGNLWVRRGMVMVAAVALGLQSAAMQSLKLPGIVTTYITGTWTTLAAGLARVLSGRWHPDHARLQLRMQAAVLAAYCASAACSGLLAQWWPPGLGLLPAVAVSAVTIYGALSRPGWARPAKV